MGANEEEGSGQGLERDVNTGAILAQEKTDEVKPTYKSFKYGFPGEYDVYIFVDGQLTQSISTQGWTRHNLYTATANMLSIRKKYRKMRIKFDEKMRQSNIRVEEEQLAEETARRLAIENEYVPSPSSSFRTLS